MMFKTLQLTVRNLRGISRIITTETLSSIQAHSYSKWTPRKFAAIVNEDELFDVEENTTPPAQSVRKTRSRSRRSRVNEIEREDMEDAKSADVTFDDEIEKKKPVKSTKETKAYKAYEETRKRKESKTVLTKVHENEKIVSSIMMSLRSKKQRKKDELILLEGVRFIEDAIKAGIVPQYIFFSRWEDIKHLDFSNTGTKLFKVTYRNIQLWSTLTTSPGVMGIFKRPEPLKVKKSSLPITIICDNVRDPGNMGSILRAAAGVGVEKVVLTKGCVDFWDTKVLRSATGAHFRVPILGSQKWDDIKSSIDDDAQIYVADNNVDAHIKDFAEIEMAEEKTEADTETEDQEPEIQEPAKTKSQKIIKEDRNDCLLLRNSNLPVIPYYAVDYTQNQVILIVGGETEGLSRESYELIEKKQGIRVNIPLDNGIDSLNAGMALGIIAFEVKRQFLRVQKGLNYLKW
ncbi:rRNA methyltransferase 3, mitochondrial [Nasonia vitripennis]|uniref:RNA 2-O ribose methyltransferase substrate binding domain-containing protein n=1 Tax=Nasonia vitripennis TaxID=7425 RepID=A0A7M7LMD6_NASVI|nr:rRNA methyltransferase 3, mitochondrial [Nasonia vitripennis]